MGYVQGGREDEARTFLETMVRDELDTLQYDVVWLNTIVSYSEIAFWLDATEAARRLLDVIAPFDNQITFEGCDVFDPVATVLGGLATVLGRFDEAESWFDKAIRLCEPGGMPKAIATAKLCWGRMLLRRAQPGDRARAIKLLREAQSTAADRGFRFVEQRASAELQRAG